MKENGSLKVETFMSDFSFLLSFLRCEGGRGEEGKGEGRGNEKTGRALPD